MSTMKRTGLGGGKRIARTSSSTRPSQPPTDFIALGTKSKDAHRISSGDSLGGVSSGKKPKLHTGASVASHHYTVAPSRLTANIDPMLNRMSPTIPEPSVACIECPPADLVPLVMKHVDMDNEQVEGLICGAIRNLRINRAKPDAVLLISMFCIAKDRPDIFVTEAIVDSLCSLLKRDSSVEVAKCKGASIVAVLSCNILNSVLQSEEDWPEILVKVFLDDSLFDRIWVDHPQCQHFVKNILSAFDTKLAKSQNDFDEGDFAAQESGVPRFLLSTDKVHALTIEILKERLSRRLPDVTPVVGPGSGGQNVGLTGKNLIRTLTSACGVIEIRCMAVQKLEIWLQNPKLMKPAQDLLMAVCINCNSHCQEDVDMIGHLTKMRLKSKPLLNHFLVCLKEIVDAHPENLKTLLSYILYNELSNARNPGNMSVVVSTIQNYPEKAAKTLASVCQDLLLQQEDYLRAVRALLREIVRAVKHEIQFNSLALGLMQEPDMDKFSVLDQHHKERFVVASADLICLAMLLSVTPHTKEAISVINGKKKSADGQGINHEEFYIKNKLLIAKIQHDTLWWLHVLVVPQLNTRITPTEFGQLLQKVLFMKTTESYHTRDNWPPEGERALLVKACHDSPVLEGSILRIAAIGLSPDHPLAQAEALDLIGQLVRRAAGLCRQSFNPVSIERTDVIDTILALCQYHHPGNIKLPSDYIPPSLAISQLYWTALQTILIVISLNPSTIGQQAWTTYPMLKVFMEMSVVNRFIYPPVTIVDEELRSQMTGKEHQMSLVEKSEILEFESHLAAVTTRQVITEESSLLLSQLIAMDPQGHPRRPPDRILEQFGQLSSRLQLGVWLCRSRQPDFLLDIINRHGENQSMSWLPDLVASTKGDVGLLPVQCLCEFLLVHESDLEKLSSGGIHTVELVGQLRRLLLSDNYNESVQVIQYFMKRLCSPQKTMRTRSKEALSLILSNIIDGEMQVDDSSGVPGYEWLSRDLLSLPHYTTMLRALTVESLRNACLVESDPFTLAAYVTFLTSDLRFSSPGGDRGGVFELSASAARMSSHLIIDRRIVVESILASSSQAGKSACHSFVTSLLEIFTTHIREAQEQDSRRVAADRKSVDSIPWSDSQDEIFVKWPNNLGAATLHIMIPQASVILLGYGPPSSRNNTHQSKDEVDAIYHQLMRIWFSEEGYVIPQAFLMDTQEEALLLPDWLRLRMLRSEVMSSTRCLAFAAVRDLEVEQLILFIQSFGIPVESMDLLLQILDSQCETNMEVILNGTSSNTSYMIRLIEVQRMRGCKAGSKFSNLLKSRCTEPQPRPSVIQIASGTSASKPTSMEVDDVIVISSSQPKRSYPKDVQSMKKTILALFTENDSSYNDVKFILQCLNMGKSSTLKTPPYSICVNAFYQLISSDEFIHSMFTFSSRACSLLRALSHNVYSVNQNDSKIKDRFFEIMTKIHEYWKKTSGKAPHKSRPLISLVSNWNCRHVSAKKGIRPRRLSSASEEGDNLRQSDWSRLEEFLRDQMAMLDDDKEIKSKVALVARILLEEISHRRALISRGKLISDDVCFTSIGKSGLLIDWLQLLDPELLAHCPDLQRKLLFEKNDYTSSASSLFNQAYLLSLLVQHCSWSTIHNSIHWLLGRETCDPTDVIRGQSSSVDPKTALDFLWVVIQAPKIWQGRENKSTNVSEPVLRLTTEQFCRLLSYIVATSANLKFIDPASHNAAFTYLDLFSVYFSKFGQERSSFSEIQFILTFLLGKVRSTSSSKLNDVWWKLLAQFYVLKSNNPACSLLHENPAYGDGLTQSELFTFSDAVSSASVGSNCRSDALLCSLLNRLGYVRSTSNVGTQVDTSMTMTSLDAACDANLILCKMASSRPFLVLRQLDLISSMLRGRTRHDFAEFKVQHHLPLMLNVATLLKKLSPYVFHKRHERAVSRIMEIFWQMVRNYCHRARRQMLPVFRGTLTLTLDYLTHSLAPATTILIKHYNTFQTLLKTYSDHEHIVSLVSSIQSVVGSSWNDSGAISGGRRPPVFSHAVPSITTQSIALYSDLMDDGQDLENVSQVLADFDESSKRRVDDLSPFLTRLVQLFAQSRDRKVRRSAVSAAVRHARTDPDCASQLLPAFLTCLTESIPDKEGTKRFIQHSRPDPLSNSFINDTAPQARDVIPYLPEMTILCRDDAMKLLGCAFDAALNCGAPLSYPEPTSEKDSKEVGGIIARCLVLLRGLNIDEVKGGST